MTDRTMDRGIQFCTDKAQPKTTLKKPDVPLWGNTRLCKNWLISAETNRSKVQICDYSNKTVIQKKVYDPDV